MLLSAVVSAILNITVLAGIPFAIYALVQRWRHAQSVGESLTRAGLQVGAPRFLLHAALLAAVGIGGLLLWAPSPDLFAGPTSPQREFIGLGLTPMSVALAVLYGFFKTGFAEEVLFRGLIAGALARRLPETWALLVQALCFLLPHLVILAVAPALVWLLPLVFLGGWVAGWLRLRSNSILGPWLLHGALNTGICLQVATSAAGIVT
ncbi:MAG TPA: CPBP family intramembrane glutamic endopeptidase [Gemmatimonadales bacterium]|nr:CPBP family intramembrane glutamic endopeptidase [Gemmatimonadales bacterium]